MKQICDFRKPKDPATPSDMSPSDSLITLLTGSVTDQISLPNTILCQKLPNFALYLQSFSLYLC